MTGRQLTAVGVAAAAGFVALVAMLEHSVAFDDWVWWRVLFARGCGTDAVIDRVVDNATRALIVLLAVATVVHLRRGGVGTAWPWVSACGLGLIASKTLKHLLTRERPSSLPGVALGYSFPSAHVMNSIAACLAIVALTSGFRRRGLWWGLAVLPTAVVSVGRVALARHWSCDVLGGGLAALALIGLVVPLVRRRPVVAPVAGAFVLTVLLFVDQRLGDAGLRLPAPLVGKEHALLEVDVGVGPNAALGGGWAEEGAERPGSSFRWLEEQGTIVLDVSRDLAAAIANADAPRLAFGGRTEKPRPACMQVAVALNGQPLGAFVPFDGWREYRLPIPDGALREGRNEVAVAVAAADAPDRFALSYLRIGARSAPH